MDYETYQEIRAYCWQDLAPYLDTDGQAEVLRLWVRLEGPVGEIAREQQQAKHLFGCRDLTPRETAAAHLLAVISNHRAIAWQREPVTPDGREPVAPLEPWQAAELWAQTRKAITKYANTTTKREAVALRGLIPDTAPAQTAVTPAPVAEIDYLLLATPAKLLDAFEKWGLAATWFDELNSHKWLLDARRKKGQGQRGHVIEPLFCPFDVMNGLIGKVRKASRLNPDTAWRTLEHKFPDVYTAFQEHDPREVTGD